MRHLKKHRSSGPALLARLILLFCLPGVNALAASAGMVDGDFQFSGSVMTLPNNGLIGNWVVGGRTVKVFVTTEIRQDKGPVVVGAFVEVRGIPQADGSINATRIEVRQTVGAGGVRIVFNAMIASLPNTAGFIGNWMVNSLARGITVRVTAATRLKQDKGLFATGAFVRVRGFLQNDGTIDATRIETRVVEPLENFKFLGTIESLPNTPGLIGDWVVSGRAIHVSAMTRIEQERRRVAVGVLVQIEGILQADGSINATEIKTLTVVSVSAASFSGTALAPEAITSGFGSFLSESVQAAVTIPLPLLLAGTQVKVKDSAGIERFAPLFFVSPTQINFQTPAGTALGTATVMVMNEDGDIITGTAQVAATAPGLFSANADGQGVAAALALRIKANGSQSYEPIAVFDAAQNKFVARPLDLGPETDGVFLILFGTGLRHRGSLSAVTAKIGGIDSQALFAGGQGDFVGLDQANLRVPRSLRERGEVEVELQVDDKRANKIKIHIR